MPEVSATPVWLGTYTAATQPYPNPMSTPSDGTFAGLTFNTLSFQEEADPQESLPGDIDKIAYYPYLEGPFKDT